ncbi:MAG TPA: hypothetical protein VNG71_16835 [Pyrinomonadaceae bacterium]|nr:hypothetical protein [Pyrinomonadaceae bacterium]
MRNLKRLVVSLSLMSVLAITAFAGITPAPPCAPPNPGETECPPAPCSAAQMTTEDSVVPGITETPPAPAADVSTIIEDTLIALLLF